MPKFIITHKRTGKEEVFNLDKDLITIGRQQTSDLSLNNKAISRKHAEITRIKKDYFLNDLESGNGTLLNGRKLKPHEKNLLHSQDKIQIEDFEIQFILSDDKAPITYDENTDSDIIEIRMIKKVLSALQVDQHPSLEVVGPPCEGRKAYFTDDMPELLIGRDDSCHLVIDSSTVSRRHAVLQKKWGGITLTDLESKNGTFVNNQKIQEKLLNDGDWIMVGAIKVLFKNPLEINLEEISKEYQPEPPPIEKTPSSPEIEVLEEPIISEEAKISASSEEKKELPLEEPDSLPKEEISTKELPTVELEKPISSQQNIFNKFLSRFTLTEKIILGIGILFFLAAFIALMSLLL